MVNSAKKGKEQRKKLKNNLALLVKLDKIIKK